MWQLKSLQVALVYHMNRIARTLFHTSCSNSSRGGGVLLFFSTESKSFIDQSYLALSIVRAPAVMVNIIPIALYIATIKKYFMHCVPSEPCERLKLKTARLETTFYVIAFDYTPCRVH